MPQTNYDTIAAEFDAYEADAVTDIELGYSNIVRLLGGCNGKKILDFGCGTGKVSRYLAGHGANVTGVDISAREIEIATDRNNGEMAFYYHMPHGHIDFIRTGSQDAVVLAFVLCTIGIKQEILRVLKMCARVLQKHGRVIILNSNMEASHGREFVSFAIPRLVNPRSGDLVRVKLGKRRTLVVSDFYWTEDDYTDLILRSGLILTKTFEPIAQEQRGWKDEWQYPPFKIFSAHKP